MTDKPKLAITYCTQCNWLLRAAWMAQEVLSTFSLEMGEVTLVPGTGGIFEIHLDGVLIWERKRDGGFPDAKQIKQLVRDRIDPGRDLGHIDHPHGPAAKHGHSRYPARFSTLFQKIQLRRQEPAGYGPANAGRGNIGRRQTFRENAAS